MTINRPAPPKKRIALFLDGTWNTTVDNTNVWRLKALCSGRGADGVPQIAYYNAGVGTQFGQKWRGGIFGYGLDSVVLSAYEWLIENFVPGDEIFIVGFSRGAYTARSLAGFISRCGVPTAGAPIGVKQLYDRYRRGDTVLSIHDLQEKNAPANLEEVWMLKCCFPALIKVIAVLGYGWRPWHSFSNS